jgi:hypothetical protein
MLTSMVTLAAFALNFAFYLSGWSGYLLTRLRLRILACAINVTMISIIVANIHLRASTASDTNVESGEIAPVNHQPYTTLKVPTTHAEAYHPSLKEICC